MCVCFEEASLSGTNLLVNEAVRDGKLVHVLGYQNTAQSLFKPAPGQPTGNAMILPFPASAAMTEANVVDTSKCPRILKDIAEAVKPKSRSKSLSFGDDDDDAVCFSAPLVFDTGIYTVVLARDPRDIPAALARVPAEKRPALKPEIFAAYAKWYPGWQIALCCFSNTSAVEADPLLWWYEPAMPDMFFVPTLDSHTGGVPDLDATVELDHVIAVGTDFGKGQDVAYKDRIGPEVRALLPLQAVGGVFQHSLSNGDFLISKADAATGRFNPMRLKPGNFPAISL